jgi:hypothetical protein
MLISLLQQMDVDILSFYFCAQDYEYIRFAVCDDVVLNLMDVYNLSSVFHEHVNLITVY